MPKVNEDIFTLDPEIWSDTPQRIIDKIADLNKGNVFIDTSNVDEISAQIAQLLISIKITAESRSAEMHLINPSEGARMSLRNLGLSHLVEDQSYAE